MAALSFSHTLRRVQKVSTLLKRGGGMQTVLPYLEGAGRKNFWKRNFPIL